MSDDGPKVNLCPFCYNEYEGNADICPICRHDLKPYKDDLSPFLKKVQNKTNIDLKSTRVRIISAAIIFIIVFTAALAIVNYIDHHEEQPEPTEGIVVDVRTGGYLILSGSFIIGEMDLVPQYDPSFGLKISIDDALSEKYDRILWIVRTESYNPSNTKDPLILTVTKDRSSDASFDQVIWGSASAGRFTVTANCYGSDGVSDVYVGYGEFHAKLSKTYSWTYLGVKNTMSYEMSSDNVEKALKEDPTYHLDQQRKSTYVDYVSDASYVSDLCDRLRSTYTKAYDAGNFADFVLSFIRSCFPMVPDSVNYGANDYWAYPFETILKGCGDIEDRAILYTSIMKTAGMDGGILVMPGTVMSIIQMDPLMLTYPVKTVVIEKRTYVVADTEHNLSIGLFDPRYDIQNGTMFFRDGKDVSKETNIELC